MQRTEQHVCNWTWNEDNIVEVGDTVNDHQPRRGTWRVKVNRNLQVVSRNVYVIETLTDYLLYVQIHKKFPAKGDQD